MDGETVRSTISQLIFHPSFNDTIDAINRSNIQLPKNYSEGDMDFRGFGFPPNGELVTVVDELKRVKLDPREGQKLVRETRPLAAYDESIIKFSGLEGTAYLASHSVVVSGEGDFIPVNMLTFYFYTRSREITDKSKFIKFSNDPDRDSKMDFIKDKIEFLSKTVPSQSILFIDGPLIGGDYYTFMIDAIERFLSRKIIPIFFVKNSSSNLVTENIEPLKDKYNSDMHWAYSYLKDGGHRTNFFVYADRRNPDNAKIFCYLKAFKYLSPQRVEFHVGTYKEYGSSIPAIMDLVYYLLLVQGDLKNPQIRPIAISEKYARETIKLVNINTLMRDAGVTPTMNQGRFAW